MPKHSLRIGIAGITGRLGHLCAQQAGDFLSGGLSRKNDPAHHITDDPAELAKISDVIIDVSHASLIASHAQAFSDNKCAWVLGTTGLSKKDEVIISQASKIIPVLRAANFSPALTMLLSLAKKLGQALPDYDAEILEVHHRGKADAPSGTALAIGKAVADGRKVDFDKVFRKDQNQVRQEGTIGFASLRGGNVIGEHDLAFYSDDEEIILRHRALDRRVFAKGALTAALWLARQKAGKIYTMEDALKV